MRGIGFATATLFVADGAKVIVLLLRSDCTNDKLLGRLQLTAREAEGMAFMYRSPHMGVNPSPASVRLKLLPAGAGTRVEIVKVQGGRTETVTLTLG